ncbi:hypothetical protein AQ490_01550 [Wenjunlia vitaminophila]|uniref:Transmembrane protein n=2 Tax=Wenjunlia vitaminophila TaxID=76728 RepID=A0A0T6LZH2_WENVI|nr:hypothetical protein [Wenjunlia vitaminophila]KRV51531.1 hypothetical protein AQ490_01550 [Wenjunlia vitaminophila]
MEASPRNSTYGDEPDRAPDELSAVNPTAAEGLAEGVMVSGVVEIPGVAPDDVMAAADVPDVHELRPERRLRIWEAAPIGAVAVLGSLMFAFPLAFGDGGRVVAMLGLLLCACSAGSGIMVARRLRHTWPGMPERGSDSRPDWRYVAAYLALGVLLGVLTIWRVSRLQ